MDTEVKEEVKEVKVRKGRFEKGSQEAKDYMQTLRDKRRAKVPKEPSAEA